MLINDKKLYNPFFEFDNIYRKNIEKNPQDINDMFYTPDLYTLANGALPWILFLRNRQINTDENFEIEIHQLVKTVFKREIIETIDAAGLFNGLSGIYYMLVNVNFDGRYDNIESEVYDILENLINQKLENVRLRLKEYDTRMNDFDIIEGFSGILKILLDKNLVEKIDQDLIDNIADYLNELVSKEYDVPLNEQYFFTNVDNQFIEKDKQASPYGNVNLSYSHGLAGVLSALTEYFRYKPSVKFQNSIKNLIDFFLDHLSNDYNCWPKRVNFKISSIKENNNTWCYGDLNIAYQIYKASSAVSYNEANTKMKELIVYYLDKKNYDFLSPTVCHGLSGVLAQVLIIEEELKINHPIKSLLYERLSSFYNNKLPYKFNDVEVWEDDIYKWNKNNFLTGSLGIYFIMDFYNSYHDHVGIKNILM